MIFGLNLLLRYEVLSYVLFESGALLRTTGSMVSDLFL